LRAAIVSFPGSNRELDLEAALLRATGKRPLRVWHLETSLPALDLVALPGGFAYGDYLRCGAIAARSPVMAEVARLALRGAAVLGICNGFQILTEAGLLPGALIRNRGLAFTCKMVEIEVATCAGPFTHGYAAGQRLRVPVAHQEGNFVVGEDELARLEDEDRIAFRYGEDINGSTGRIAGVLSRERNVLGLMPHPEDATDPLHGSTDGEGLFSSLARALG
jgi:phosphoribosylformylglycinamidine synthase